MDNLVKVNAYGLRRHASPQQRRFGETTRPDAWWLQPLVVFLGFSAFIVYSTWAAFQGVVDMHRQLAAIGSAATARIICRRFISPEIFGHLAARHFRPTAGLVAGAGCRFSPAFLILWTPAGFRFTCYYYRGAYYKAFWADPINCAVGEPRKTYLGEQYFPLIIQNIHRYFFYLAVDVHLHPFLRRLAGHVVHRR